MFDMDEEDLLHYINIALPFIDNAYASDSNAVVFVHCRCDDTIICCRCCEGGKHVYDSFCQARRVTKRVDLFGVYHARTSQSTTRRVGAAQRACAVRIIVAHPSACAAVGASERCVDSLAAARAMRISTCDDEYVCVGGFCRQLKEFEKLLVDGRESELKNHAGKPVVSSLKKKKTSLFNADDDDDDNDDDGSSKCQIQ